MVPAEQKKLREEDNSLLAVANDHIAECERYAMIVDEELGNVSAEVQILMEEFVDLMPVEMLDELPPMTCAALHWFYALFYLSKFVAL